MLKLDTEDSGVDEEKADAVREGEPRNYRQGQKPAQFTVLHADEEGDMLERERL